jgi:hypothetical protein
MKENKKKAKRKEADKVRREKQKEIKSKIPNALHT